MHFIDETAPNGTHKQEEIFVQRGRHSKKCRFLKIGRNVDRKNCWATKLQPHNAQFSLLLINMHGNEFYCAAMLLAAQ